ncbi:BCCT family transporter [Actinomycetaceae bacterium L2_0104]
MTPSPNSNELSHDENSQSAEIPERDSPDSPPAERPEPPAKILKPVFISASVIIIALVVFTVIFSRTSGDTLAEAASSLNHAVADGVGWWYVIAVNIFLFFALYCAFSRVGNIRLGRDGEKAEFGIVPWFLMLFSAGMGIGLVFFGVAEPLSHYVNPPEAFGNAPSSDAAAAESVGLMMLQWGLHPWAIYSVVGLGLAYMTFRRGRPLAIRWLLEPLLDRKRVEGWIGHAIDAVAIVGTLFGVATSLGFGVSQIMGGLEYLGWAERSNTLVIVVITVVTAIALWSVVSGVHKGLKWLSNVNMGVAALLAVAVFILGPTTLLLKAIPENAGQYISLLPETMLHTGPFASDGWETVWTIGYWGWWTSWAPFVGMFIARISRGRTIREFVIGVLLAPTVVSLIWFTIFGDSSIIMQRDEGGLAMADPVTGELIVDSNIVLFQFFESFSPLLALILSVVAMIVVALFFVTSSDSGSLVIDMLACGGRTNTPVVTRVYWSVLEGAVAAILLIAGGAVALTFMQTLSVSTAAPFSVILVLACVSLGKAFRHEVAIMPSYVQLIPTAGDSDSELGSRDGSEKGFRRRARKGMRGMSEASATLVGLPPDVLPGEPDRDQQEIVSFRSISSAAVSFDPDTGAPAAVDEIEDPLAGEVFDTPEFEESQEYLNQNGLNGGPVEVTDMGVEQVP